MAASTTSGQPRDKVILYDEWWTSIDFSRKDIYYEPGGIERDNFRWILLKSICCPSELLEDVDSNKESLFVALDAQGHRWIPHYVFWMSTSKGGTSTSRWFITAYTCTRFEMGSHFTKKLL